MAISGCLSEYMLRQAPNSMTCSVEYLPRPSSTSQELQRQQISKGGSESLRQSIAPVFRLKLLELKPLLSVGLPEKEKLKVPDGSQRQRYIS
eukprot:328483-Amphidinium_carterae.2